MTKKSRDSVHDKYTKELLSKRQNQLAFLRLALPDSLYGLFSWKSLRPSAVTYASSDGREVRTDLTLSASLKGGVGKGQILFLIEHKAQKDPGKVLLQLLDYQNAIYRQSTDPVVPVIIYHGKSKSYKRPLEFHFFWRNILELFRRSWNDLSSILSVSCSTSMIWPWDKTPKPFHWNQRCLL